MSLEWKGDAVSRKMAKATRIGINETMAEAVIKAKMDHSFTNRTGTLERSVRIQAAAKAIGDLIVGLWGSVAVNYAPYIEFGTKFILGGMPFLRPAAAVAYPRLASHIKDNFRRL